MNAYRSMPLGKLFSQLTKAYLGTFSKRLEPLCIKRYHYALMLIHEGEGQLSQQSLADELFIDKVSVVRIVDYLQEAQLVQRKKNPDDRREQLLIATHKGRNLIPAIRQAMLTTNELSLEGFTAEEVGQMENLLSRMLCNLKQQPQDTYHVQFIKSEN